MNMLFKPEVELMLPKDEESWLIATIKLGYDRTVRVRENEKLLVQ
jgi:hypothetical protein